MLVPQLSNQSLTIYLRPAIDMLSCFKVKNSISHILHWNNGHKNACEKNLNILELLLYESYIPNI